MSETAADELHDAQCRSIDFDDARQTDPMERAVGARDASDYRITSVDDAPGLFRLKVGDGDVHETLLVGKNGHYVGACDCEAFVLKDVTCSHLCLVRVLEQNHEVDVPHNDALADNLLNGDADDADEVQDVEVVDTVDGDGIEENADSGHSEDANGASVAVTEPAPPTGNGHQSPDVPTDESLLQEQFKNADEKFVVEIEGDEYITKAGYTRLAAAMGHTVRTEAMQASHEGDTDRAVYRATVYDEDGNVIARDVGSSGPPEAEDMTNAAANLDELAITRAKTRALSWSTGEGITALVEVHPDREVHDV